MADYKKHDAQNILLKQQSSPAWISHVQDHVVFLRRNSRKLTLPDEHFYPNMARPKILLKKAKIADKHILTVLMLNNISLVTGFEEHERIIDMPSIDVLDKLESSFPNDKFV